MSQLWQIQQFNSASSHARVISIKSPQQEKLTQGRTRQGNDRTIPKKKHALNGLKCNIKLDEFQDSDVDDDGDVDDWCIHLDVNGSKTGPHRSPAAKKWKTQTADDGHQLCRAVARCKRYMFLVDWPRWPEAVTFGGWVDQKKRKPQPAPKCNEVVGASRVCKSRWGGRGYKMKDVGIMLGSVSVRQNLPRLMSGPVPNGYPSPTRYTVFFSIPNPTKFWKLLGSE